MNFTNNLEEAEKFDNLKTKVLRYVLYKKRTETEVRKKFESDNNELLEDIIEFLKEYNYINDEEYIEKSISEFKNLKNMSIKEIKYKLLQKGIDKNIIENYFSFHEDELIEFEVNSARNIICKKIENMNIEDIQAFLYKKGYQNESIKEAKDSLEL